MTNIVEERVPELLPLKGNIKLIAICGKRLSGKTTLAEMIMDINPRFRRLSFATPLKNEFCFSKGIDRSMLDDIAYKEKYRTEMQNWSKEYLEADLFHFLKALFKDVKPGDCIVIDDLRYLYHEFLPIVEMGGFVQRLVTDDTIRASRGWKRNKEADEHQSETDLDLPSIFFHKHGGALDYNNKGIDTLKSLALDILKRKFL